MIIDFQQQTALTRYHLLTQTVVPRPIAWVLSENEDNSVNLAPFSFFNAICSEPPLLVISIGKKATGEAKDTRRNILSGRDCVIHIASVAHANAVSLSATDLQYGDSEVKHGQLAVTEFPGCPLPRLRDCHIAYHCRLYDSHEIGPHQQAIIYVEVLQLYVKDDVITHSEHNGKQRYTIDTQKVDPLARLGGATYADLGNLITVERP